MATKQLITTAELAAATAGGDDYIRTKDGVIKGIALNLRLNLGAPDVVVVGKGPRVQTKAQWLLASGESVPTYIKLAVNQWVLAGHYRALGYHTDKATIEANRGNRPRAKVAGILRLAPSEEIELTLSRGFAGNPEIRRRVEQAAIKLVWKEFEKKRGYKIKDVQKDNCGYDLLATKGADCLKLEVKGTAGDVPRFFLTRNEWRHGEKHKEWRLVVVTFALSSSPKMQVLTFDEVSQGFTIDALVWECRPPGSAET